MPFGTRVGHAAGELDQAGQRAGEVLIVGGQIGQRRPGALRQVTGRPAHRLGGQQLIDVDPGQRISTEVGQRDAQRQEDPLRAHRVAGGG